MQVASGAGPRRQSIFAGAELSGVVNDLAANDGQDVVRGGDVVR